VVNYSAGKRGFYAGGGGKNQESSSTNEIKSLFLGEKAIHHTPTGGKASPSPNTLKCATQRGLPPKNGIADNHEKRNPCRGAAAIYNPEERKTQTNQPLHYPLLSSKSGLA